jgi:hypothetical protein
MAAVAASVEVQPPAAAASMAAAVAVASMVAAVAVASMVAVVVVAIANSYKMKRAEEQLFSPFHVANSSPDSSRPERSTTERRQYFSAASDQSAVRKLAS